MIKYKIKDVVCENLYFTNGGVWYKNEPGFKIVKYFLFIPIDSCVGNREYLNKEHATNICNRLNKK